MRLYIVIFWCCSNDNLDQRIDFDLGSIQGVHSEKKTQNKLKILKMSICEKVTIVKNLIYHRSNVAASMKTIERANNHVDMCILLAT